ncbi:MAG: TonB-dependent receptor, partial [Desulfobacteraceae bacterium]|nr:TonB-dependent receptor [Desulfobacteraceae bacterium]
DTPATARWDHRLFASLQYLHSSGLSAWVTESLRYFDLKQSGLASQEIWLTDVGIGYQLPGKRGRLRLAVNNLFDRHFDWVVDPYIFDGRVPRRQILFTASMDF